MFRDRQDAGRKLAEKLAMYRDTKDTIVLGLPRGGIITAYEVSQSLNVPMDIVVPRKIGFPGNPEFAIGAISEEGEAVFFESVTQRFGITKNFFEQAIQEEKKEAERRLLLYRSGRTPLILEGKTAILADDGVATGATMRAAILSARRKGAKKVVVASPVIAPTTLNDLRKEADQVVYLSAPFSFAAVGNFYEEFPQTSDEEVIAILKNH